MSAKESPHYRPDIDGLRALAVLPVLLFHAQLGCPGGYVGVDIFFVISGFLIAKLIFKELREEKFRLAEFWERRIRRILPALAVVAAAVFIAGWFLYLPADFQSVGKSLAAQAALVSNVFFHRQAGYFEAGSDTKPLLHTWSLAVEEQFYLLFPLLLLFLWRRRRSWLTPTLIGLALVSFGWSVWGSYAAPSATFYLLPTRAWELLAGVLLALPRQPFAVSTPVRETAGWLGLGLVGIAILWYDETTRFPGWAAVPPCLGAALIIFSSASVRSRVGRLLAAKPVVFVGLISYSLYLWHWPLLVFATYPTGGLRWKTRAALLGISVVLAVLSWKFIETPCRTRRVFPRRSQIFAFAAVGLVAMLGLGLLVHRFNGVPERIPADVRERVLAYADARNNRPASLKKTTLAQAQAGQFLDLGGPITNQPVEVFLWGDSHALVVSPVLDDLCRRFSRRGMVAFHPGTAPVLGYRSTAAFSLREDSAAFNDAILAFITRNQVKHVILAARWPIYPAADGFKTQLLATVRALLDSGAKVYVLKDVPKQDFDVPRFVAFTVMHHGDPEKLGITPETHQQRGRAFDPTFAQLRQMGATVLDPAEYFRNRHGLYGVVWNDRSLYFDGNHLSSNGSMILAPLFEPIFH